MLKKMLVLNKKDNVGVLLEDGKAGDSCSYNGDNIKLTDDIVFGHKVALKDFEKEDLVIKYGEEIGYALGNIKKGQWVHNRNMGCRRGK